MQTSVYHDIKLPRSISLAMYTIEVTDLQRQAGSSHTGGSMSLSYQAGRQLLHRQADRQTDSQPVKVIEI
jgi:hypothetical protein